MDARIAADAEAVVAFRQQPAARNDDVDDDPRRARTVCGAKRVEKVVVSAKSVVRAGLSQLVIRRRERVDGVDRLAEDDVNLRKRRFRACRGGSSVSSTVGGVMSSDRAVEIRRRRGRRRYRVACRDWACRRHHWRREPFSISGRRYGSASPRSIAGEPWPKMEIVVRAAVLAAERNPSTLSAPSRSRKSGSLSPTQCGSCPEAACQSVSVSW